MVQHTQQPACQMLVESLASGCRKLERHGNGRQWKSPGGSWGAQANREARETTTKLADAKQQLADAKLDLDTCLHQCAPLL